MENFLLANFEEIWPRILYYIVHGHWPDFGPTLNIHKKSNFDQNQLKLLHNIITFICIRKCNKNGEFSPSHF